EAILERAELWRPHVRPEGPEQEWDYLHVYIPESFRVERCNRVEREILTELAVRASAYWELDRRGAADELGARLGRDPSRVRSQLLLFKQGCQWLLERLEKLADVLEAGKDWDAVQHRLALNLFGVPRELRDAPPPWDPGSGGDLVKARRELVREEIAAMRE